MQDRKAADTSTSDRKKVVNIGQSLLIRGEVTGSEDMAIQGTVEGTIDLTEHNLTIGPKGRIQANVSAKAVVVQGEITGNINASEKVELAGTSRVNGEIIAPRIIIADGARLKGSVDMSGVQPDSPRQAVSPRSTSSKPASTSRKSASTPDKSRQRGHHPRPAAP